MRDGDGCQYPGIGEIPVALVLLHKMGVRTRNALNCRDRDFPCRPMSGFVVPRRSSLGAMSQDPYSPVTGRWGVEGFWDVVFVGLAIAGLALLVLILARTRREREVALLAALVLIPAFLGIGWLGGVQVDGPNGNIVDCLMRGRIDGGSACGAAYLGRYAALMIPLTLILVALVCLAVRQVRRRDRHRLPRPA